MMETDSKWPKNALNSLGVGLDLSSCLLSNVLVCMSNRERGESSGTQRCFVNNYFKLERESLDLISAVQQGDVL